MAPRFSDTSMSQMLAAAAFLYFSQKGARGAIPSCALPAVSKGRLTRLGWVLRKMIRPLRCNAGNNIPVLDLASGQTCVRRQGGGTSGRCRPAGSRAAISPRGWGLFALVPFQSHSGATEVKGFQGNFGGVHLVASKPFLKLASAGQLAASRRKAAGCITREIPRMELSPRGLWSCQRPARLFPVSSNWS